MYGAVRLKDCCMVRFYQQCIYSAALMFSCMFMRVVAYCPNLSASMLIFFSALLHFRHSGTSCSNKQIDLILFVPILTCSPWSRSPW